MNLDYNTIKTITQGAVKIVEDSGFIFHRFTAEQEKQYALYRDEFIKKTQATAGICLEFVTDSLNLYIDADLTEGTTRRFYTFDVLCDNKIVGSISNYAEGDSLYKQEIELGNVKRNVNLREGVKTVKIVFPWSVVAKINEISIDDNAIIQPVPKKAKMLFFGDSITHGYDALHPIETYVYQVSEKLGVECYNKAIGGESFFPELLDVKDEFEPEYISVAYGTNDWNKRTHSQFRENCSEFYRKLVDLYPNSKIFAITPIWRKDRNEERAAGGFEEIREFIFEVTDKYENVIPISGYDFVPKDGDRYFADGYLHPNSDGFKFYATNLYNELKKYI